MYVNLKTTGTQGQCCIHASFRRRRRVASSLFPFVTIEWNGRGRATWSVKQHAQGREFSHLMAKPRTRRQTHAREIVGAVKIRFFSTFCRYVKPAAQDVNQ